MVGRRTVRGMRFSFRRGDVEKRDPVQSFCNHGYCRPCIPVSSPHPSLTRPANIQHPPPHLNTTTPTSTIKTNITGLNTNNTTAAGLINPITTFVAHRFANFSSRLASVPARISKSLREGVSASRYQPVESLETRRKCLGRRRGEGEGEV
jgi:hypothetical protein